MADSPFSWTVEVRVALTADDERAALLAAAPDLDRLVVCHADACVPNTLVGDDGSPTGHVDLGRMGVADRWADLAVATNSLGWNFRGNWEAELLDAYGVERDEQRATYYRRLWDAT